MDELTIIYDGECPFCRNYVRLVTLREAGHRVSLVDAREDAALTAECAARGLSLDDGMVVIHRGAWHHGAEAMHRIALLSTPSGALNRINRAIFRHRTLSRVLYPPMRAIRNLSLRVLGVGKIAP